MESVKYDTDKPMMNLVPLEAVEEIARILTYGAKKYSPNGWQDLENFEERYTAALLRHLTAYRNGEEKDPESSLPHVSHMATNALFLVWKEIQKGKK